MPFGLRNATQTFQRFVDAILRGLNFYHGYIDDILIASKNEEEHRRHLEKIFQRLSEHGLSINVAKRGASRLITLILTTVLIDVTLQLITLRLNTFPIENCFS